MQRSFGQNVDRHYRTALIATFPGFAHERV